MRLLLILAIPLLTACQSYRLQGMVIAGDTPAVALIEKGDVQLQRAGLPDAVIEVTLDPESISPIHVGSAITDGQGRFSLEVNQAGAGFLEYDAALVIRKTGYASVSRTLRLPPRSKRVLVVVAPGQDRARPSTDIIDETLQGGKMFDR